MEENLKIIGWNANGGVRDGLGTQSNLGGTLLRTVWDFTQFDQEKDNEQRIDYRMDFAKALQAVLKAAELLGYVEHTNDWDPLLEITLRNGEKVESESHYYQIDQITDKAVFIEAPSREGYKELEMEIPKKYYVDTELKDTEPALVIPLAAISLITIDAQ